MKKLTAIFLSLLMVCSLSVGILAAEDPKAIYLAAEEKTNALTSMDFDAKGKMSIVVEDGSTGASQTQTLDVTFAVDAQVNATNPENPQMNMNMEASVLNQSFQAEIYFKDQYL